MEWFLTVLIDKKLINVIYNTAYLEYLGKWRPAERIPATAV
jgi:hypothetical protein